MGDLPHGARNGGCALLRLALIAGMAIASWGVVVLVYFAARALLT
jgi:hypothetical protein